MEARATTLSENTAFVRPRGLLGEWGLSVLVERDDRKILLDAGASMSAARNGGLLGINWDRIDAIVLSHGHYDHTGGLREVLTRIRKQVKIFAHPDVFDAKFIQISKDESPEYMASPFRGRNWKASVPISNSPANRYGCLRIWSPAARSP